LSLRARMLLLMALLALVPGIFAVIVTRQIVVQSLELSLSGELDRAVETGLRHSAQLYRSERERFRAAAARWAVAEERAQGSVDALIAELRALRPLEINDEDRVELIGPEGQRHPLQSAEDSVEVRESGDAPATMTASVSLPHSWRLELTRATDPTWRADAAQLQQSLQLLRVAHSERSQLERSYWVPFMLIYGLTLLFALGSAWQIGRGITVPVSRLVEATERVGKGDWTTQVATGSGAELRRLTDGFNAMVRTLDAQSQRLVDLEKMSGWREMARTLAHEVKNPLTPIQLTVEEMRQRYRGDDAEYAELLDECTRIVVEEVESLRNVVQRFREFSRPVELRPVPSDLNRLLADVAAMQKDLQCSTELDASIGEIEIDSDRIRQMLMNLAENARNALEGRDDAALRLFSRADGETVEIRLEDNGPGIPQAEWERVFEPYRSGRAGGLGLGMALSKGIVLAHHGEIHVEESREGGAAIVLRIPRIQPREEPA